MAMGSRKFAVKCVDQAQRARSPTDSNRTLFSSSPMRHPPHGPSRRGASSSAAAASGASSRLTPTAASSAKNTANGSISRTAAHLGGSCEGLNS
jgi:hypothetical protein